MKHYTNAFTPLHKYANTSSQKVCDIPRNTVIEAANPAEWIAEGDWAWVIYRTSKKPYEGWVPASLIEPYVAEDCGCVTIDDQTEDPNDAQQFTMYRGVKQTNLCGELCAARLLGVPLSNLLEHWQVQEPSFFKRIFSGGKATGTGVDSLMSMFKAYSVLSFPLGPLMFDTFLRRSRYTVRGLVYALRDYSLIVSCKIDKTGYLVPSGDLHWVVLRQIIAERAERGQVQIYNPFSNCSEWYSWREFIASAVVPSGVAVEPVWDVEGEA